MKTAIVGLLILLTITTGSALYWRLRCERLERQLRDNGIEPADDD